MDWLVDACHIFRVANANTNALPKQAHSSIDSFFLWSNYGFVFLVTMCFFILLHFFPIEHVFLVKFDVVSFPK